MTDQPIRPGKRVSMFDEIASNKRKSIMLMLLMAAVLMALVLAISYAFAPEYATIILLFAGIFVIVNTLVSYKYGGRIALASVGAYPADEKKHIYLINTVEGLAIAAGIPKPKCYIIPSKELNAFACGKDPEHASIAVTEGLMQATNRQELEGVVAHEMSHIRNYDIRFATLISVLVGMAAIISYMFLRSMLFTGGGRGRGRGGGGHALILIIAIILAIVAPLVVRLVQLAVSRKREYLADASGAQLTRYPDGLASALEKIAKYNRGEMKVSEAVSHMFFSDPTHSALDAVWSTHPPIQERIKKLRAM